MSQESTPRKPKDEIRDVYAIRLVVMSLAPPLVDCGNHVFDSSTWALSLLNVKLEKSNIPRVWTQSCFRDCDGLSPFQPRASNRRSAVHKRWHFFPFSVQQALSNAPTEALKTCAAAILPRTAGASVLCIFTWTGPVARWSWKRGGQRHLFTPICSCAKAGKRRCTAQLCAAQSLPERPC